jgi:hypothetical protein
MDLPELVQRDLDGESVLAHVELGGDDAVIVTPTRTLVYRAEGLLSDESATSYSHDAERVELRSGRRKTTFRLGYVDGAKDFTVPSKSANEVLVPLLEGLLRYAGLLADDEAVRGAYRFSELTLVVTDNRVLKHVGGTVWDEEYDEAPFEALTGLGFEEGSVATEIAVEVDGYPQRFKIPNEHAGTVRRTLQEAVFGYYDVDSLADLETLIGEDEEESADVLEKSGFTKLLDDGTDPTSTDGADAAAVSAEHDPTQPGQSTSALGRVDPERPLLDRDPDRGSEPDPEPAPAAEAEDLVGEVAALRETVERQGTLLERQQRLIEQLVEELRRGR